MLTIQERDTYDVHVATRRGKSRAWGGRRPGAGRKSILEDPVRLTFDLERRDFEALEALAMKRGISVAAALRMAVQRLPKRLRGS